MKIDKFLYKTNANPKKNILISENIGQRRLDFSRKNFNALFYHFIIIFNLIKFKISSKYVLKKQLKVTIITIKISLKPVGMLLFKLGV